MKYLIYLNELKENLVDYYIQEVVLHIVWIAKDKKIKLNVKNVIMI